ncbi:MAG: AFG1 family ATPase [Beijerinckiaceae bacterium]|nr:AFG1 family ATPase [Beijerinckiaceae bacterium]
MRTLCLGAVPGLIRRLWFLRLVNITALTCRRPSCQARPVLVKPAGRVSARPVLEVFVSTSLLNQYAGLAAGGHIEADSGQEAVLLKLEDLRLSLADYCPARTPGAFGWLKVSGRRDKMVRGLYIWGGAGRGKTMLMDLFFGAVPVDRKSRVHFHEFMTGVHALTHEWRERWRNGAAKGDEPVAAAADSISQKSWLLCFDEFSVTDIADAMILGRLFEALFARGVVIVATSNVRPELLYQDGLNRALFLPFIAMIEAKMEVVRLDARADYRFEKLECHDVYIVPPGKHAWAALTKAFKRLTGAEHGAPGTLQVLGRKLLVPEARANVARFSFADLCEKPLGAADYLAIARQFHTVLIDAIPVIGAARRDEAKRFITLIDTLYDRHVKLIASAEAEPDALYLGTDGYVAFEIQRTASRLAEMRSKDYLALPHGPMASMGSGNTSGLAET